MKILVVNKFFFGKGGAERVMFDLIRGYEAAGHEVVPFSMASAQNVASPWAEHFVPEVRYDEVRGIDAFRAAVRAVYSGDAKRRLLALLRVARPDVCHLHNFHHQLSPSIVDALRERGIPAVHTLHDYKVVCPSYLLFTEGKPCMRCRGGRFHEAVVHRCIHGRIAPSAVAAVESGWHRARRTLERGIRCYVAPSRFLRATVESMGFRGDVRVVPNGVAADTLPVADRPGSEFLYVGRLSPEKGVATLLAAAAETEGIALAIAGTGPQESALRARADALAPRRITFLGSLPREAVLARMRAARAVVLPSECYENAPMTALEALGSGVPVIGADIGGIPEIVRDGETGLLVPPGSAPALAQRLARLRDDPDLAHRLGRAGRRVVEQEYRLADQTGRMLQLLAEVSSSASR